MKKFMAFTLAETLLAMSIIGIIGITMMKNINKLDLEKKTSAAQAYKVLETIQQAASNIRATEPDQCPSGHFLDRVIGSNGTYSYEYAIYKPNGSDAADADAVRALFKNHMKFEKSDFNFCTYSNSCTNSTTKGARIVGGVYIGFEVFGNSALQDCPTTYYLPTSEGETQQITKTAGSLGKCWGKLYVDIDGTKGSGTEGHDVFIWGLGEDGIVY